MMETLRTVGQTTNKLIDQLSTPETRSQHTYTNLQTVTKLLNNVAVVVEPHPTYNNVKFVFTCGSIASLTVDEIKAHLEEDNVTDVYRFTRKSDGKSVPTNSYVVTMQAVKIPEYIYIGMERIKTRVYYPRPMRCLQFGHTKNNCKNGETCATCGALKDPWSVHTAGKMHKLRAFDTNCPKYKQEAQLIKLKIDHNCSYREAKQMIDSSSGPKQTLASTVQQRINVAQAVDPKDQIIISLTQTIENLNKQIARLNTRIDELHQSSSSEQQTETETETETDYTTTITSIPTTGSTLTSKHQLSSSSSASSSEEGEAVKIPATKKSKLTSK
uniref:Uncharacterized protein n=1 Tax=Anopheles arabiensis TaxID=7173 RepID=A0A182HIA2_ANOAR